MIRRARFRRQPTFWLFAAILVSLGVLGWVVGGHLRAQDRPSQTTAPRGAPQPTPLPPTVNGSAPSAPQPVPIGVGTSPSTGPQVGSMMGQPMAPAPRFQFKIAPNTPLKDLLPTPPKVKKAAGPVLGDDLAKVPEVEFQAPQAKDIPHPKALEQTAHQIAKVNHLNAKKTDAFLEALRGERPDLHGLPYAMGDACRTKGERSKQFAQAVSVVRGVLQQRNFVLVTPPNSAPARVAASRPLPAPANPPQAVLAEVPPSTRVNAAKNFWEQYRHACDQEDRGVARIDRAHQENVTLARIAALVQVLAPESPSMRLGLVKFLATVSHVEATRALARLAIFSAEDEVRQAATDALKVRREKHYTDILLAGLSYPWPAVARRTADAVVKLERKDLLPQLVGLLEEPDPRAPAVQQMDGKKATVVRELVKINHHRNCLLCHAPGNTGTVSANTLTAAVPLPTQPLPSPSDGYQTSSPDVLVRIDVTYLRQDFSAYQPVTDANPWPEMQRFDFLVRTRELSDDEVARYREKLKAEPGRPSPYQSAALVALRGLTGQDTEPNAEAWRRLLKMEARPRAAGRNSSPEGAPQRLAKR